MVMMGEIDDEFVQGKENFDGQIRFQPTVLLNAYK